MGGLGKTTLAQLVYNDERVKNQFETRNWVCVSDDFDVKRLTKAIIETMGGTASDLIELESMQSRLREMLSRRRFLLVLDDVWNENQDKWDKLKFSLTCGIQGCSILVTTRLEKVESIMGTFPAHHLKGLSKDDCWALFKQRAFGDGREEIAHLVVIGKEIVKKCGGVPLAAKALGSLMRFKNTETEWLFVRDSEIWDLPEDEENNILPALRLSYNHLPSHLRQCFAYCSMFPKDHWIEKEQLVHLWMANGFIPSKGKMELEDIGNEIFNELVWRSFFQDVEKNDYLNVVNCKMHDLVHDLACSILGKECLTLKTGEEIIVPKGIRHLSLKLENMLSSDDLQMLVASTNESLRKFQTIRTLLLNASRLDVDYRPFSAAYLKFPNFNISNRRCLRALELSFSSVSWRPSSAAYLTHLRYLIHLRYLKLYMISISTLPESLSNLKHLQTLILDRCRCLQKLPAQLSTMSSLRHLDICGCESLRQMPIGIGKLIHLQTLSTFIVGKKTGYRINELKGLNLRGQLHIRDLENVKNSVDAKEANLMEKRNLNWLTLSWSPHNDQTHIQENVDEVLEGLQPPISMKKLEIERYQGMKFPSWMEDLSLQNLVRVQLIDCSRCENFPPLGHLPFLKFLHVSGMDSVRYLLDVESDSGDGSAKGFPLLEELQLYGMLNLEELLLNVTRGREVVVFPYLVSMRIMNCDKLKTLPLLPSLKSLFLQTKESENIPEGLLQNRNLPVLESLTFDNSPNLVNLPRLSIRHGEYGFSSLKEFGVNQCNAMKYLWEDETQFQGLCSLKVLRIEWCERLVSLPRIRYLTALERLYINQCPGLELSLLEDFRHLTSLQKIDIINLPQLISLAEILRHTTTLQHLRIFGCEGLTVLPEWIENLTSLRTIEICYCPNLTFLPDGLRQLTMLQTLVIKGCPVLETRCREGGEDWQKIYHIPKVIIRSWPLRTPMKQNRGCWGRLLELKRRLHQILG
ncbi:putative disease resistance protein RGA3 [Macadamia integrifolia]|uniref:putative disease resistance protein RGA3 n=1 Tax=Macadamia integrifolia TaxID=60698 RepID=UPI001C4F6495|nr:putative disease resistance protein RGA3 [Macadamia integrifolia]